VSAELSILGDPPSRGVPVSITAAGDSFLRIANAPPLPLNTPVKVLDDDCLWLGRVIECRPDGTAMVQILHSLNNLTELTRLAELFTGRVTNRVADGPPAKVQPNLRYPRS
jgi:hypothetical protein